jgi:hypothetical protein
MRLINSLMLTLIHPAAGTPLKSYASVLLLLIKQWFGME